MLAFTKIGLIAKYQDPTIHNHLSALLSLLQEYGVSVFLDQQSTQALHDTQGAIRLSRNELGKQIDLAIVIGGDGTLLQAARSLHQYNIPILGINLGRLGFLVDLAPYNLRTSIPQILAGHYQEEHRHMLKAQLLDQPTVSGLALNDVVIHKPEVAHLVEIGVYVDDCFITNYRADGLIISTPTGSSAYALSSGGPLISPTLPAILLAPICPHTLTHRPIVLPAQSTLKIKLCETQVSVARISCDGQLLSSFTQQDSLIVQCASTPLRLIHPDNYDYFNILRNKLNWGQQLVASSINTDTQ